MGGAPPIVRALMWWKLEPPPPPPPPPPPLVIMTDPPLEAQLVIVVMLGIVAFGFYVFWYGWRMGLDDDLAPAEAKRRAYRAEIIRLTFGALKGIAMADGEFHPKERELLEACTKVLHVRCPPIDEVPALSPEELAGSILAQEAEKQAHLLMLMVHVALVDGDEHPAEFELVERHAAAFGVEESHLQALRRSVRAHYEATVSDLSKTAPQLARSSTAVVLSSPGAPVGRRACHWQAY